MKKVIIVILICLAVSLAGAADKTKVKTVANYVAVLDIDVVPPVDKNLVRPLSDSIRREIIKSGRYEIMDRSNMERVLKEQAFQMSGCVAKECAVQAGQMLGVGKIVVGSVSLVGSTYYTSLQLINVETSKTEGIDEDKCKCEVDDLIESTKRAASKLMEQTTSAVLMENTKSASSSEDNTKVRMKKIRVLKKPGHWETWGEAGVSKKWIEGEWEWKMVPDK